MSSLKNFQNLFSKLAKQKGFSRILENAMFISAGDGKCSATVKIEQNLLNHFGYLHGGGAAGIIDCMSSFAFITKYQGPFASSNMNLCYFKKIKEGDEVLIEGAVIKEGAKVAFLEGTIKSMGTEELLAKGIHTVLILK